jgi:hypothetical protein
VDQLPGEEELGTVFAHLDCSLQISSMTQRRRYGWIEC